jgi:hypothetical protein
MPVDESTTSTKGDDILSEVAALPTASSSLGQEPEDWLERHNKIQNDSKRPRQSTEEQVGGNDDDDEGIERDDNVDNHQLSNLSLDSRSLQRSMEVPSPKKTHFSPHIHEVGNETTTSQPSTPTRRPSPSTPPSIASTASIDLLNSFHTFGSDDGDGDGGGPLSPQEHHALQQEMEGIRLLRQIFPNELPHALRDLYYEHVLQKATAAATAAAEAAILEAATPPTAKKLATFVTQQSQTPKQQHSHQPKSKLGQLLWKQAHNDQSPQQEALHWPEVTLPDDFLRLPPSVAVRRYQGSYPSSTNTFPLGSSWRYQLVHELEQRALQQEGVSLHGLLKGNSPSSLPGGSAPGSKSTTTIGIYYTAVLFRDAQLGLGMTLHEEAKLIRVHALAMSTATSSDTTNPVAKTEQHRHQLQHQFHYVGPSYEAGILPGDVLIGINGSSFRQSKSPKDSPLKHAVTSIHQSPDPVVLHLQRQPRMTADSNDSLIEATTTYGTVQKSPTQESSSSPIRPKATSFPTNGNGTKTNITSPPARRPPSTSLLDEEEGQDDVNDTTFTTSSPPRSTVSSRSTDDSSKRRQPSKSPPPPLSKPRSPSAIHPFATALAARDLLHTKQGKF